MSNTLKGKDYRRIFFLYGIVYATISIIITEITWDEVANLVGLQEGLLREIIESFLEQHYLKKHLNFMGL